MGKTYEVKAKAPPREGFPGFWSAQRHWPGGELVTATVDARELKELLADDKAGLLMVQDADALREQLANDPDAQPASSSAAGGLTPDEQAALDAYRKSKAATVNQAELQAKAKQEADAAKAKADADQAGKKGR